MAIDSMANTGGRSAMISYERLVSEGEGELCVVLDEMGYSTRPEVAVSRAATTTTDRERRDIGDESRLASWNSTLPGQQVDAIERVVRRFGMTQWMYQ